MKLALIALIGAAGALAACANDNPPPMAAAATVAATPAADTHAPAPASTMGSGCFYTRDITNHQIADDRTLYLKTRSNAVYRLDMSGACLAGHSSDDPLIIKSMGGIDYVCRAVDMDISIGNAGMATGAFRTPCIVSDMTRLSTAQVAALPKKARP